MTVGRRIHIGHEIEARINELKISKSEFARRIGISKQNVARILERESVDTALLAKYGEALDFNFFNLYADIVTMHNSAVDHSHAGIGDINISSHQSDLEKENRELKAQLIEAQSKIIRLMETHTK